MIDPRLMRNRRDATEPHRAVISPADVKAAVPGDPCRCAVAKCFARTFGGNIEVYRTVAYLEVPDEKGETHVERFRIPRATQDAIARIDKTGEFEPNVTYWLRPPSASNTLTGKREGEQRRRARGASKQASEYSLRAAETRKARTAEGVRTMLKERV